MSAPLTFDLRVPHSASQHSPLAVVTTLSLPCTNAEQARLRAAHYQAFAAGIRRTGAPLFTLELAGPESDFLTDVDGTAIHCRRETVAPLPWQKEHQLNCLIAALPRRYEMVAWIDCDVLFDTDDWAAETILRLEQQSICQLFDHARWLDADGETQWWIRSCLSATPSQEWVYPGFERHPGFAWAARRDFLQAIGGLYALCGTGAGDSVLAATLTPHRYAIAHATWSSSSVRQWQASVHAALAGVSCLPDVTISHLYHGDLQERCYLERESALDAAGFDPGRDLYFDGLFVKSRRADLADAFRLGGFY